MYLASHIAPVGRATVSSINRAEYDELVAFLRESRESAGLSQEGLSKKLGEARNYAQKSERKDRRFDVVEFVLFAEACGLDPRMLFD